MRVLPFLLAFALVACSAENETTTTAAESETAVERARPAPPSSDQARALIADSAAFGDFEFSTGSSFSLPLDTTQFNEPARAGARDLEKGGWIRIQSGSVVLAKGEGDPRFLVRPNGFLDVVPLAKKELLEVEAVRPTDQGVEVDFTWRWIPNEVGASFTSGGVKERFDATHAATAKLQDFGAEWDVLLVERVKDERRIE
ncbi:MAG TPA: hypothetical protein VM557_09095 [Thermoanaerobaculia bacterium]|nr:hypothetical protein [Thermoanaerobaculia bacterium]